MSTLQEAPRTSAPDTERVYASLLVAFEAAYSNMRATSEYLNALLVNAPAGLPDPERSERVVSASAACEDARQQFASAASEMTRFLIADMISSRPHARPAACRNRMQ